MFNPWKIQNNGSLATRKGCSMLKKISYRCCIFWGLKYNFLFLKYRASFFFLPTSCVECKVHVFIKKFFSFPYRNRFLLTILKGLKPFWLQVKTWNWIKELLALEFCRNQNKVISILTETHINHDQIHHIRNNWLGSNFFSLGDSHTKGCLSCFIRDLNVATDPKGMFVSFKFTPSNERVFCVYAPSGYSNREQLEEGVSLKDYKIIWKIKIREMKTK